MAREDVRGELVGLPGLHRCGQLRDGQQHLTDELPG